MTEIVVFGTSRPKGEQYMDWNRYFDPLEPGLDFSVDHLSTYIKSYLEEHDLDSDKYDIVCLPQSVGYGECPRSFTMHVTPKPTLPSFSVEINYAARKPRKLNGLLDQ